MNQTRVFLFVAWAAAAIFLWTQWGKFTAPKFEAAPAQIAAPTSTIPAASVPGSTASAADASVPQVAAVATPTATAAPVAASVTVQTDVLRVVLDGGSVSQADLLRYPESQDKGAAPVRLFAADAANYYVAQSGWINAAHNAPTHLSGFVPEKTGPVELGDANEVSASFVWTGADGVGIRRTYTFKRGEYVIGVHDEIVNHGAAPWQGQSYQQLLRKPPVLESGFTHPEAYSFHGAVWYGANDGYNRYKFKDFLADGKVDKTVQQGWVGMLQHHFFSAWIPASDAKVTVSLDAPDNGAQALIREVGGNVVVAPGQQISSDARLWVGPKLVEQMKALQVPGLDRAVDYSRFSVLALLCQGLFWILGKLHALFGNWGWAIIGLVVMLKAALFRLSAAQYKSAAKMRKFAPRLQQLKERYGDDQAKYQQAMMELYKKEKINPVAGCLPVLPQMIIFMALYWMLAESVELRQAPWMLWIHDLTSRDPFFVLPVLNVAVMFVTQRLTPAVGMDPTQQKMMQIMPLGFGAVLAFLPAGLVLYQVTNGALGLLQQWYMLRKYGDSKPDAKPAK